MSETATAASLADKNATSAQGAAAMLAAENAMDEIVKVICKAHGQGMVNTNERDHLCNDALVIKYMALSLHCRLTAAAKRSKADVPPPPSDGGGVVIQGGPGR